jgi:hypothetical protein
LPFASSTIGSNTSSRNVTDIMKDYEVQQLAIHCLGNMCSKGGSPVATSTNTRRTSMNMGGTSYNNISSSSNVMCSYYQSIYDLLVQCLDTNYAMCSQLQSYGTPLPSPVAATIASTPIQSTKETLAVGVANGQTREGEASMMEWVGHCRVLGATLRALQFVITEGKNLHESHMHALLNKLKNLLFFGIGLQTLSTSIATTTTTLLPSNSITTEFTEVNSNGQDKLRENVSLGRSDWVYRQQAENVFKVRLHAVQCVAAICKCSPKLFYGHWSLFIPPLPLIPSSKASFNSPATTVSSSTGATSDGLLGILHNDPATKVRIAAAATLATIIDQCRSYLLVAANPPHYPATVTTSSSSSSLFGSVSLAMYAGCI